MALGHLIDTVEGSLAAAGTAHMAFRVVGRATEEFAADWMLAVAPGHAAVDAHSLTMYLKELCHDECRALGPGGSCCNGFDEKDKHRAEVRLRYSSFPLHLDCLVVLMESRDTSTIAAEHEGPEPQGYAGCMYLKGDLPAFCHNSEQR